MPRRRVMKNQRTLKMGFDHIDFVGFAKKKIKLEFLKK
jgi:hypothetical protein